MSARKQCEFVLRFLTAALVVAICGATNSILAAGTKAPQQAEPQYLRSSDDPQVFPASPAPPETSTTLEPPPPPETSSPLDWAFMIIVYAALVVCAWVLRFVLTTGRAVVKELVGEVAALADANRTQAAAVGELALEVRKLVDRGSQPE